MTEKTTEGQEEITDPTFEESYEDVKFADFDKKSPLLGGGYSDEGEEEGNDPVIPIEEPLAEEDTHVEPEGGNPAEEEDAPVYKTIKVGASEYKLKSELELEELAKRGLEFGEVEGRLQPYSHVIDAIEQDPGLANAVAEAIRAYKSGVPLSQPTPEKTTKEDQNKEPEQGDDEDYDDYEKRLTQWREDRNQRLIDQKIQDHFKQMQEQSHVAQIRAANTQIINYVKADPEKDAVLAAIQDPSFPAGLRKAMDNDGPTFMSVYDTIRRSQGKSAYFGAPSLFGGTQQQVPQAPQAPQTPARKVPFTESGNQAFQQVNKGGVGEKLPDFKGMTDDDFRVWKEKFMLNRQGL